MSAFTKALCFLALVYFSIAHGSWLCGFGAVLLFFSILEEDYE